MERGTEDSLQSSQNELIIGANKDSKQPRNSALVDIEFPHIPYKSQNFQLKFWNNFP